MDMDRPLSCHLNKNHTSHLHFLAGTEVWGRKVTHPRAAGYGASWKQTPGTDTLYTPGDSMISLQNGLKACGIERNHLEKPNQEACSSLSLYP